MHTIFKGLLVLTLSIFISNIYAQTVLEGRIREAVSGKPIGHARIYIPDLNVIVYADSSGYYRLNKLRASSGVAEFSCLGYNSVTVPLRNATQVNEKLLKLDVEMEPTFQALPEVVVKGIANDLPGNTSYTISTLSKDAIQTSGALTLTDALAKMPGVSEITTGPGISKPVIRGLYGNRIVTIYEGIRFDNQQWQDEHGLGLSDVGVDHVELIKGPASLLYGSEAIGGVINIVDERPAAVNTIQSDINFKAFSNTQGLATEYGIKGATENRSWRIRAGLESHADYIDGLGQRVVNTRFSGGTLKAGMSWFRTKRITTLDFTSSLYNFGYVTIDNRDKLPDDGRSSRSMEGPHHSVNYHILSLQNTWLLPSSTLKLNLGIHVNNRQEQENGNQIALNMLLNTLNYDLRWSKSLDKRTALTIGSQGMGQTNSNFGSKVIIPDAYNAEASAYGYIRRDIHKLTLEGGLRFDFKDVTTLKTENFNTSIYYDQPAFSKTFMTPNGSVGGVYHFARDFIAKMNLSSGYRAPNLAELSSNGIHEGTYRYELGDPNMKHEESIDLDAGLDYNSKYISFYLNGFCNNISHFVYLANNGDSVGAFALYRFQQANAMLYGGEAGLDIRPGIAWLDWYTTFATVTGKRTDSANAYLPFIPANKLSTGLRLDIGQWHTFRNAYIRFGLDHYFKQDKLGPFETLTPAYTLWNAAIGGVIHTRNKELLFSVVATNLSNTVYIDHLSRFKGLPYNYIGGIPQGIYNMGRNISLSLRILLTNINNAKI